MACYIGGRYYICYPGSLSWLELIWSSGSDRWNLRVPDLQMSGRDMPTWQRTGIVAPAVAVVRDHDEVIKWKHFPRYWQFVRGIHRSLANSPHKGQWCRALMFSLICAWINGWVNNGEAGDLRRHRTHYDVLGDDIDGIVSFILVVVTWL